jgi:hypothetical protein
VSPENCWHVGPPDRWPKLTNSSWFCTFLFTRINKGLNFKVYLQDVQAKEPVFSYRALQRYLECRLHTYDVYCTYCRSQVLRRFTERPEWNSSHTLFSGWSNFVYQWWNISTFGRFSVIVHLCSPAWRPPAPDAVACVVQSLRSPLAGVVQSLMCPLLA